MELYFILILLVILYFLFTSDKQKYEYKKWYQCYNGDKASHLFRSVLEGEGLIRTNRSDWDLYIPCASNYSEKNFNKIVVSHGNQIISFISKNGVLGSKQFIWTMLEKYFGRKEASKIMPPSYVLPKDANLLRKDFNENKIYVMKKEKQRQLGLSLSNNLNQLLNSTNDGYKIIQEYLDNPLKYNGHKINFRIYLLIVCDGSKFKSYVYDDGIISYSEKIKNGKIDFKSGVASFYTSKKLYDKGYPIILSELKANENFIYIDWKKLHHQFCTLVKKVLQSGKKYFCKNQLKYNNKTFQIFGIDFLVRSNLDVRILEINIGPGMDPYCERDSKMRKKMFKDILSTVGIIDKTKNGFVPI